MDPLPPNRHRRDVLVIAGVVVLVVVIARASAARRPGAHDERLAVPDVHGLLGWLVVLFAVFAILVTLASLPGLRGRGEFRHRSLLSQLIPLVLIVVFLFAWGLLRDPHSESAAHKPPAAAAPGDQTPTETPVARPASTGEGILVVVVLAGGAALALLAARRTATVAERERTLGEEISDVLDAAIDDLRAEPDPRQAVIRAYQRTEQTFAAHGLPRRPADAPLEYLARVLAHLDASRASITRLTALFERAMFSQHAVDTTMKDDAIAALVAVRDELRAGVPA